MAKFNFLQTFFKRSFSSATKEYDVVFVGGGPGGYIGAIKAAQLGLKVACVESRGALGGTCLNVGCIPSKALLNSSHHYYMAQHDFKKHGINVTGLSVDLSTMLKNKDTIVSGLTSGIEKMLFKKAGVEYVKGFGKILSANEVKVKLSEGGGEQNLKTKNVVISTGSEPTPLKGVPVNNDNQLIVDSTGALSLSSVPEKLLVIGGGVIGLELGSVWMRLGSQVTVVEYMDRLTPEIDSEISATLLKVLKKQGMKFKLSTAVQSATENKDTKAVSVSLMDNKTQKTEEAQFSTVLVSTGRRPFYKGAGLEELGIKLNKRGFIEVAENFETNVKNIYAIGDCIPGPMLAHKAEEEGVAIAEILAGKHGHVNYNAIPSVIYTHPEVASVGKTEDQLKKENIKYSKGIFPMMANSRARTALDSDGLVKVLVSSETDQILGMHLICANAGEMIAEATLALEYGASAEDVARTCHAHPTLAEAVKEACMAAYDKPLNI